MNNLMVRVVGKPTKATRDLSVHARGFLGFRKFAEPRTTNTNLNP